MTLFAARPRLYVNARAIIERDGPDGSEVLLQRREKRGEPRRLEFPGGQLDPYESILDALKREVQEETGLAVTGLVDDSRHHLSVGPAASVECLTPSFVYQTTRGPVDSVGFFFRVRAEGQPTARGDQAGGHVWWPVAQVRQELDQRPDTFDWLTRGALPFYLGQQEQA